MYSYLHTHTHTLSLSRRVQGPSTFHFKRIVRAFIASLYFALSRDGRLARLVSGKVPSLFHRPLHPNPSNHRLDIRIPVFLEERPQRWTYVGPR